MRYIDADKHLQKLRERRDAAIAWRLNCDEETKDRAQEAILIFNECIAELLYEPTAGVRENATGEWIESMHRVCGEREYKCSNCNKVIWSGAIDGYHFCPNCGADMRGEA